jgi:L-glyceraldehyde 3-phosphate reductase
MQHIRSLNEIATSRGQTLAQLALAWVLRDRRVTSVLVGASSVEQLDDSLGALETLDFSDDELNRIDEHAVEGGINLWKTSSDA